MHSPFYRRIFVGIFCLISICLSFPDQAFKKEFLWYWKSMAVSVICEILGRYTKKFWEIIFEKVETLQRMYGLINVFVTRQFPVFSGCFFFCYCFKKLKSAQITQIKQLFQLFNLICAYGYTFYGVTLMLNYEQKCKQWCQQRFAYYIKTCTYHMYLYCTSLLFSFFQWCLPLHFYFNCCSTFILNNTCLHLPFLRNNHRRWSDCQRGWRQEDRW